MMMRNIPTGVSDRKRKHKDVRDRREGRVGFRDAPHLKRSSGLLVSQLVVGLLNVT